MSSVFGRLGFNFDTNEFGDSQYLTPAAIKTLNAAPTVIPDWQVDALAAGTFVRSDYFKNPHAAVYTTLSANVASINTIAHMVQTDPETTFPYAESEAANLAVACRNYIIQLNAFKSHTDNMSCLGVDTGNTDIIPNYDMAVSIGHQVLRITNTTDDVANTTPMLGSFTSLFIGDELSANNTTIYNDKLTVDSAMAVNGNCVLGATQVNQIIAHIQSANTLIYTRRMHDWNFYTNSVRVVNDYLELDRFNNLGNTQIYLVNNLIGKETLVNNLANT